MKLKRQNKRKGQLSRSELMIAKASNEVIIQEYRLIEAKKSLLSAHLRDVVKMKIDFLLLNKAITKADLDDKE